MFHRLHLQLTGLCALITISILTIFTILYLSVSEHAMKENATLSFQNHFDTLMGSLEQQSILTYSYLLRMEQNNDCLLFLWDNGVPLSFNELESHAPYLQLAGAFYMLYCGRAATSTLNGNPLYALSREELHQLCPKQAQNLELTPDICMGVGHIATEGMSASEKNSAIKKNQGLVLLVLSPNTALYKRLAKQRIAFALLSLTGCFLLTLFSYGFTSKMLKPIRENQEKQLAFVAGASHELRTPLAVILSAVSARPSHFEKIIREETLRMGRLVDELLLLSQLDNREANSEVFKFKSLDPDTFLLNFYEQIESYVSSQGRSLTLSLPEDPLPQLYADEEKLRQLIEILVQNAISYTETGGRIQLSLHLNPQLKHLCFEVSDNGIGIPDAEKKKVFERFYQAESSHSSKEHFGLGLSIAKEIMAAHKGEITVTDAPGGGCVFSCIFSIAITSTAS